MRAFIAAVVVLALVSCSEPSPAPLAGDAASPSPGASRDGDPGGDKADRKGNDGKDGGSGSKGSGANDGSTGGGSGSQRDGGGGGGDDGSNAPESSGGRVYPASGKYTYAQQGWEEFCQAACQRDDLPPEQLLEVSLRDATDERAVVVAEARQSQSRTTRTTALFTRSSALITNLYSRVSYSGFAFEENIDPDPPIDSLFFPLEVGKSWSGRWKADTSGNYSVSVSDRAALSVNDKRVNAFVVRTTTQFHGEYEGNAQVTVWLDPVTRSVVKSTGDVQLQSDFGRYATHFDTTLQGGPGYR
jgi:hypothetical protein